MSKRLILVGGGHAHLLLLKNWRAADRRNVEITLISEFSTAVYSGMVPGHIAGTYSHDEIQVDLAKLAAACGVTFHRAEVTGLDVAAREVITHSAGSIARVPFDFLSLDVGSRVGGVNSAREFSIKPLQTFLENWRRVSADPAIREIDVIGGGAAGLELALAMASALRSSPARVQSPACVRLYERDSRLLPQMPSRASRIAMKRAHELGVEIRLNSNGEFDDGEMSPKAGERARFVATGPTPAEWLKQTGLKLSRNGFICVDEFLRAEGHANIFAVGDCAEWVVPIPRSGVYAVRQSPILLNNLRAACDTIVRSAGSLQEYRPQKRSLYLLSLGAHTSELASHKTLLVWGPFAFAAKWLWYVKRWIDRRYVRGLQK